EFVNERLGLWAKAFIREAYGIQHSERLESAGKFLTARHRGILDQNGNYELALPQCRLDLDADEVTRIIQPPTPVSIGTGDPIASDHGQQHVTYRELLVDSHREVEARLDAVDVEEYLLHPEGRFQMVAQASGERCVVVTAVADKDIEAPHAQRGQEGLR